MSEKKWSPEPWRLWADGVPLDANGQAVIVSLPDMTAVVRSDEDARRIVACVNACAGLSTEALEAGALGKALGGLGPDGLCSCGTASWHTDPACAFNAPCWACAWRDCLRALGRLP